MNDYSGDFQPLRRRLLAETGGDYLQFINRLAPRYWRVWLDIALGYVFLGLILSGVGLFPSGTARATAGLVGAVAVGYGLAYLQLFLHEAAHYHLARNRALNDRLCDALISWQVFTTVRRYRPIHFAHHRHLGTPADTENSYCRVLGLRLILETLTGVHALRILRNRQRELEQMPTDARVSGKPAVPLLRGILFHAVVATTAFGMSGWPGLVAWMLGVTAFFPVFATLRQLLEHRSSTADPELDYAVIEHGAFTRMFGGGLIASTFGAAGFNRHLLHHWEPQVPYTRLGELERYLANTCAEPVMATRRSSYLSTLTSLWCGPSGRLPAGR